MKHFRDEPIQQSNSLLVRWFSLDCFEPERAVSSYFVKSRTLFFIRLVLSLYSLVVLCVDIIWSIMTGQFQHFFAYFTDLTYIGINAYLLTTLYHHIKYLQLNATSCQRPVTFFDQPPVLNYLYVYLYHTVIVFNIQTPVVFWSLLANERLFNAHLGRVDFWISISLHAVTLFTILVEVLLNRMVVQTKMVLAVYGTVLLYMFLTFIIFAVEKWWVYSFLDWSVGPSAAIWYLAISVIIVAIFFFQMGLHKTRDLVARLCFGRSEIYTEKHGAIESQDVPRQTHFEPLASTIGGSSGITLNESQIESLKASSIYF